MKKTVLLLASAALLAACTGSANPAAAPADGSNSTPAVTPSTTPGTTSPTGANGSAAVAMGALSDAEIDAMIACVKGKPAGDVWAKGWTQYKGLPQNLKDATGPSVRMQGAAVGCTP